MKRKLQLVRQNNLSFYGQPFLIYTIHLNRLVVILQKQCGIAQRYFTISCVSLMVYTSLKK